MSLSEVETNEELNQELNQLEEQVKSEEISDRKKMLIGWITSGCLHAACIMLTSAIYFIAISEEVEAPPVRVSSVPIPPVKPPDVIKNIDILENNVLIETDTKDLDAKVPITSLDLPVDEKNSSDDDMTPSDIKKGREEAVADSEQGANGFLNTIGVGGGASGMYGNRQGGGSHRARQKMGNMGKPSASATDAGLRWLKRHQSPNGMWDAERYFQNCTEDPKCEPGSYGSHAAEQVNVAMTGYATLCFLGAGYDHKTPSKYKAVVSKAINYLLSVQKPDGMMGERNYEHPVATMALVEAYGMTNDPDLRKPAQNGIDMVIAKQLVEKPEDPYSSLLWDYTRPNIARVDISVTGWNIMALKSAVGAGLNVKESISGAKKGLERVWKAANPDWEKKSDPYKDTTIFPYTWNPTTNETKRDHLSFVGATCAVFLGHVAGDSMLETMLNDAEHRWIDSGTYKHNSYACYYLSLSMFQAGGDRWKKCLGTVIPYAVETQNRDTSCLNGSWSADDQSWAGKDIGRVLSTCYNILNLEVAYRYAQVHPEVKILKK